jgi:hypothetical protein
MGLALLSRKRADFGPDRRVFRAKAGNLPDSYAILRIAVDGRLDLSLRPHGVQSGHTQLRPRSRGALVGAVRFESDLSPLQQLGLRAGNGTGCGGVRQENST